MVVLRPGHTPGPAKQKRIFALSKLSVKSSVLKGSARVVQDSAVVRWRWGWGSLLVIGRFITLAECFTRLVNEAAPVMIFPHYFGGPHA